MSMIIERTKCYCHFYLEFCLISVWYQNVPEICVLSLTHNFVLVQYRHVMDGQTDRCMTTAYTMLA